MNILFYRKLLLDSSIPFRFKIIAYVIGLVVFGVLSLVELPVEAALAFCLPLIGVVGDVAIEGSEFIAVPLIVAALVLPFIAPSGVVNLVRCDFQQNNATHDISDKTALLEQNKTTHETSGKSIL